MTTIRIGRRAALAAGVAALASPAVVRAQADPIKLATLTPLTGAGGPYGPVMAKAAASVVEEVNKAGGVLGRRIVLVSEDDQTNPEAAVRAARKLIDVTKVPVIMGTWASAVTTAVAPDSRLARAIPTVTGSRIAPTTGRSPAREIGRASCRERV